LIPSILLVQNPRKTPFEGGVGRFFYLKQAHPGGPVQFLGGSFTVAVCKKLSAIIAPGPTALAGSPSFSQKARKGRGALAISSEFCIWLLQPKKHMALPQAAYFGLFLETNRTASAEATRP
jgi:hypothetical protein